ncbi:MAG: anti-sigma factor family protein [Blastocatellia bacterium]
MQNLDCRNLMELLDSYLSDELSVESNHAVLRHLEQCPGCRAETTARRDLRQRLRGAIAREQISPEARNRIQAMLREEAAHAETILDFAPRYDAGAAEPVWQRWRGYLTKGFRLPVPALAAMALLLMAGAALFFRAPGVAAATLSEAVMAQAAGDHDYCAAKFAALDTPLRRVDDVRRYDPALVSLDEAAGPHAAHMKFHIIHKCGFGGREFAHLVYTRGGELISLLVTARDAGAMRNGIVPADDGLAAGLQQSVHKSFQVSAYQTRAHVVLVVSRLPEKENTEIARTMGGSVSAYVRDIEVKSTAAGK